MTMITIYSILGCEPCEELKKWLNKNGIPFREILNNHNIMEYPTVDVDGKIFIGYSQELLNYIIAMR